MNYERVSKPKARKYYYNGLTIKLLPCKCNDILLEENNSYWIKPVSISMMTSKESENNFDREVNEYEYYNCNAELGYYAHYYVSKEELEAWEMCGLIC